MQFSQLQRREFITLLGGATAWPLAAHAQQPAMQMRRIGVLMGQAPNDSGGQARVAALLQGLQELGWSVGQNMGIDIRWSAGRPNRATQLVSELVQANVEVILAGGTELIQAAQNTLKKIPVVMTEIGDPVGAKVVASLARPGGHVTGLSLIAPELAGKRLELAKEALPGLARVAMIWNPNNASVALRFKETEAAAQVLGLRFGSIEVRQIGDFEKGLKEATQAGVQALITTEDTLLFSYRSQLVGLATGQRLPTISGLREFADAGGLLSYGPSSLDPWRRAAGYVDKILRGAKPADLPVEQPTRFELVINLKAARVLGLEVPPTLLARADEVIE